MREWLNSLQTATFSFWKEISHLSPRFFFTRFGFVSTTWNLAGSVDSTKTSVGKDGKLPPGQDLGGKKSVPPNHASPKFMANESQRVQMNLKSSEHIFDVSRNFLKRFSIDWSMMNFLVIHVGGWASLESQNQYQLYTWFWTLLSCKAPKGIFCGLGICNHQRESANPLQPLVDQDQKFISQNPGGFEHSHGRLRNGGTLFRYHDLVKVWLLFAAMNLDHLTVRYNMVNQWSFLRQEWESPILTSSYLEEHKKD